MQRPIIHKATFLRLGKIPSLSNSINKYRASKKIKTNKQKKNISQLKEPEKSSEGKMNSKVKEISNLAIKELK